MGFFIASLLLAQLPTHTHTVPGAPDPSPPQWVEIQESVYNLPSEPIGADPVTIAQSVLGSLDLRIREEQNPSLSSPRRVLLDHFVDGYPVARETVRVNWLADGSVFVVAGLAPDTYLGGAAVLDQAAAEERTLQMFAEYIGAYANQSRLEVLPLEAGNVLAWRVEVASTEAELFARFVWLDANNGLVLGVEDPVFSIDGQGAVFDPNPIQTLHDPSLRDNGNDPHAVPPSAYMAVTLKDLDGSGFLTGPWATTEATPDRYNRPSNDFTSSRTPGMFEEVMAYYHVDTFQRYLQSIGLTANMHQQNCNVHYTLFGLEIPNAFYSTTNGMIAFGTGGVDFAEDAEVVIHEYGHAIHDDVQGGLGSASSENRALSEGYGDLFACLWADDPLLGEWVGTHPAIYQGGYPLTRRSDKTKKWPDDTVGLPHDDGEIWSAAVWELYLMVGLDTAMTLVVEALALQTNNTGFATVADFLIMADQQVYGGAHANYIEGAMRRSQLRDTPASAAMLDADRRSLLVHETTTVTLSSPQDANAGYWIVLSENATSTATGAPFNTTLDIDTTYINKSPLISGLTGSLDASGNATFTLGTPQWIPYKTNIYMQAMILDQNGAATKVSAPIAMRKERE